MDDFSSIYGELEDIIGGGEYTNDLERLLSESVSDDQLLQELLSDQKEAMKSQSSSLNTSATSENGDEEFLARTTQNSALTELSPSIQNEVQTPEEYTKEEHDLISKPPPLPMKPLELTPIGLQQAKEKEKEKEKEGQQKLSDSTKVSMEKLKVLLSNEIKNVGKEQKHKDVKDIKDSNDKTSKRSSFFKSQTIGSPVPKKRQETPPHLRPQEESNKNPPLTSDKKKDKKLKDSLFKRKKKIEEVNTSKYTTLEDASKHRRLTIALQEMALKVHNLKDQSLEKRRRVQEILVILSDKNLEPQRKSELETEMASFEKDITQNDILIGSLEVNIEVYTKQIGQYSQMAVDPLSAVEENKIISPNNSGESPDQQMIIVHAFDELPPIVQAYLPDASIPTNDVTAHFEIILDILHLVQRTWYLTPEQYNVYTAHKKSHTRPPVYGRIIKPFTHFIANVSQAKAPSKVYKFIKHEGRGGFGRVYFAKDKKKGEFVAIKKLKCTSEKSKSDCAKEVSFLKFCKHQNIVNFIDFYLVEDSSWIITEFLEGATIKQALDCIEFQESHIAYIIEKVLLALKYLHGNQIVHRDIKGDNVMITVNGDVKLIDMGLCVDLREMSFYDRNTRAGTTFWMSPESITGKEEIGGWIDIWSLGMTCLEMANGDIPNSDNSVRAMFKICTNTLGPVRGLLKNPEKWSDSFVSFVESCLTFDPFTRPTVSDLLLNNWIKENVNNAIKTEIINLAKVSWAKQTTPF